ncbi:hypothetical protein OK006_6806 [Actinobacteria bacterium OK006]|nr:hypothetical protein OK006_6806 [Actinobacteria bacterium OK006]
MSREHDEDLTEGTSPRVRGAARLYFDVVGRPGNIPAGAGSSLRLQPGHGGGREHPRGCGEQANGSAAADAAAGTSPRVRGAAPRFPVVHRTGGNIPAGAGSSCHLLSPRAVPGEHPRGCGEQPAALPAEERQDGTSPRVRGAGRSHRVEVVLVGNIPAGAGSRQPGSSATSPRREHPRGCGEQHFIRVSARLCAGTSPRVRGAEEELRGVRPEAGNIPAGAGSRAAGRRLHGSGWEHPRGCGEQPAPQVGGGVSLGTSPRVRGAVEEQPSGVDHVGNIPTGAGSRAGTGRGRTQRREHPRGCGEQRTGPRLRRVPPGTSPRVRGAAQDRWPRERGAGNIPAGAGSRDFSGLGDGDAGEHPRGCGEQR